MSECIIVFFSNNWQYLTTLIISIITLWFVLLTYNRSRISAKLSIIELKFKNIPHDECVLFLNLEIENKGKKFFCLRDIWGKLSNEILRPKEGITGLPERFKLQPKEKRIIDVNLRMERKFENIAVIGEKQWIKIGSGKKIRFIIIEDNSGKKFKSKKVKFEDIIKS